MATAVLKVDIIADASKLASGVKQADSATSSFGSKLGALGKAAATGFAVTKVVEFGAASVKAASESAVAGKRLDAVFRAMGDTTGTASKAAQDYAQSLSMKIGVDDEAIQAAQAQLATFKAVSDETGRSAGIFDRATAAAADLAAAGFGSLDTNAVQLGKALQDPVKGITALAKSGVTFTKAQKDQIAAMVKSGDLLGAQKVVLGAVEGQVKGTAAATATGADKMAVAYDSVQESVGNALLPVLEKLAPILVKIADFVQRNISWILPLAAALGVMAVAWNIASIAVTLFGTSMLVSLGWVLLIIAAIAAVVAVGVLLVKNWDTIKAAAAAVWQALQAAWDAVLGVIQRVWNWISANWPLLLAILTGPIGLAVLLITRNWDTIKGAVVAVVNWIRDHWQLLLAILTGPIGIAAGLIIKNWDRIKSAATALFDWVSGKFQAIVDAIRGVADRIGGIVSGIADAIKGPINAVLRAWNGIEFKVPEVNAGPIHFGGQTIGLPDIPLLASGGTVMRTGMAIVHAGEQWSGVGGTFGGTTNIHVTVNTTGLGADAPEIQRGVVRALRGYVARNGPLPVPVTGRR